jgi:hypothetical protein
VERQERRQKRFPGLRLAEADQRALKAKRGGRQALSERRWRRMRILELLDQGWNLTPTAAAVGTYPREVRPVGWRYLARGLEAALNDPRPKPGKLLDAGSRPPSWPWYVGRRRTVSHAGPLC